MGVTVVNNAGCNNPLPFGAGIHPDSRFTLQKCGKAVVMCPITFALFRPVSLWLLLVSSR